MLSHRKEILSHQLPPFGRRVYTQNYYKKTLYLKAKKICLTTLKLFPLYWRYFHYILIMPAESSLGVMTVDGLIHVSDMGTTLVHEHVLVDWFGTDSTGYQRWNREVVI